MARTSAGLLPYHWADVSGQGPAPLVFLGHMGGPLWARRDDHAWSIVKGEYDADSEDARTAARREFMEETGAPAPDGDWVELGVVKASGKTISVWAVEAPATLALIEPGTFEMEWPPHSGRRGTFPEIDRAEWLTIDAARTKLVRGQLPFLDRLTAVVS